MEQIGSFQFGQGFGDIAQLDNINLADMDLTDTLLGSAREELAASLGYAESNAYEAYHKGDAGGVGISDISLTVFDSALIQEVGIRPYTQDLDKINVAEEVLMEEVAEVAESIGAKTGKGTTATEGTAVPFVEKFLARHDKTTEADLETSWLRWNDSTTFDWDASTGELIVVDDEAQIGEDDKEENELEEVEFDNLLYAIA